MDISINDAGSTVTVTLAGRLDVHGAESIDLPLATLSGSKNRIVMDMSQVTFIASIGLRHLVTAAKALQRRGGELILLNPTATVAEVVTSSGLINFLPIERSAGFD